MLYTAKILNDFVSLQLPSARLGHIGGDDFILVCDRLVSEEELQSLCRKFDEGRDALFSREDAQRGCYETVSRRGESVQVPLLSLSLAAVTSENFCGNVHPGRLGQVAALIKNKVKAGNLATGCSGCLVDRRVYQ